MGISILTIAIYGGPLWVWAIFPGTENGRLLGGESTVRFSG